MGGGMEDTHKEEMIRQQKEREDTKQRIVNIINSYSWVIAEDVMKLMEDLGQ